MHVEQKYQFKVETEQLISYRYYITFYQNTLI
jgi:hypothetical protein